MSDYQYKAFISYRHLSPDQDIAKKLHSYIENYNIPSSLKSSLNVKEMGRVFRDIEELPLSSNLGDDIHKALENSEWFVCICSPRYLESKWCMEELRYFISLGRRDHVLAILVEDEPEKSFPREICVEEKDGELIESEPLAADVRAASLEESLEKLKNEKLRIIAPMLGVNYDDLKQRSRQRRNRIIVTVALGVIVLLASILGYTIYKNNEVTKERNDALIAQSKWLAQSADKALEDGDKMLSMLLSLEALPEDYDNPDRPFVDLALDSLRSAVMSDLGDNKYYPVTEIKIPNLKEYRAYNGTLYCYSKDADGFITAYDLATGKELEPSYKLDEEPFSFKFDRNLMGYAVYKDKIIKTNGIVITEGLSQNDYILNDEQYKLVTSSNGGLFLLQPYRGAVTAYQLYQIAYHNYREEVDGFTQTDAMQMMNDTAKVMVGGYAGNGINEEVPAIIQVNLTHKGEDHIEKKYYLNKDMIELKEDDSYFYLNDFDLSYVDLVIAGTREYSDYIYFWKKESSELKQVFNVTEATGASVKAIAFSPTDAYTLAISNQAGDLYLYDVRTNKITLKIEHGLGTVGFFMWSGSGKRIIIKGGDDIARIVSTETGEILQSLECNFPLRGAIYADYDHYGNGASDDYVILVGDNAIQIYALSNSSIDESTIKLCKDESLVRYNYFPLSQKVAYSKDGKYIFSITRDGIHVIDAQTLERVKVLREDDDDYVEKLYSDCARLRVYENYLLYFKSGLNGGDSSGTIRIYDTENLNLLTTLIPAYEHTCNDKDRSRYLLLTDVTLNHDESILLTRAGKSSGNTWQKDPSVFVFDMKTFEQLWMIGYDCGENTDRIFDFAKDWKGRIELYPYFMKDDSKILIAYRYDLENSQTETEDEKYSRKYPIKLAFEIRNTLSGDVLNTFYINEDVYDYYLLLDKNLIVYLDTDYLVHIIKADSGEEIMSFEGIDRISSCTANDELLQIKYFVPGSNNINNYGHEVNYKEATVKKVRMNEVENIPTIDGYINDKPFVVESTSLVDAETGETLFKWNTTQVSFIAINNDGTKALFFKPENDNSTGTSGKNGNLAIIKNISDKEIHELAIKMLDGRELTSEQKEKYFLD